MKNTLKLMLAVLVAFVMSACGENVKSEKNDSQEETKVITQDDLEKLENTLTDENGMLNKEAATAAVEQFCEFVKQNPDDSKAPYWLSKAMQIAVSLRESDKAIELTNKLVSAYPDCVDAPVALFRLASDVYDEQLHDLGKASATYERVIKDYPGTQWAADAEILLGMLGMTPDEMLAKIRSESGEEEME